ncbi:hypothetical protein [Thiomicrorhabdus chilensis]|uniref:hypothetical protein n=1 Tax=Thiomicrorhabdus chilensis TaxID=63656 RepID=UPI0004909156|nr:hypothetical protein [Thiomicrorhabdus chilensis]
MRTNILIVSLFMFLMAGCASNPNSSLAMQCENGLDIAYKELDYAKANGFDGTVEYTKALSLLSAAKIQQQFGKYPNCIDKVERAREYIKASQR